MDGYLVQYEIAGYENGVPLVYSLTLMPDWNAKTVNGPFEVVLKKGGAQGYRSRAGMAWPRIRTEPYQDRKQRGPREFHASTKLSLI